MEIPSIHGWQALLVVIISDEMYGRILWKFLPCMDAIYPRRDAIQIESDEALIYLRPARFFLI